MLAIRPSTRTDKENTDRSILFSVLETAAMYAEN